MEKVLEKTEANFNRTIVECLDYVNQSCDIGAVTLGYLKELLDISSAHYDDAWDTFADSGVFHDAIGEVTEITPTEIHYVTEY